MKFLISLKSIGLVHGDVLINELVHLFVHIVGKLSPDTSSVAEKNENQQDKKSHNAQNYPPYDM
jgi:hypothetical protein